MSLECSSSFSSILKTTFSLHVLLKAVVSDWPQGGFGAVWIVHLMSFGVEGLGLFTPGLFAELLACLPPGSQNRRRLIIKRNSLPKNDHRATNKLA